MQVDDAFYDAVLRACGLPVSAANLFACHAWQTMEGGTARHNPWNTTKEHAGATNYNSVGVKNYATESDGIHATAETLQLHYYDEIRAGFAAQDPQRTADAIDHSPWGTHGVGAYVRAHWHGKPQPPGDDEMTAAERAELVKEITAAVTAAIWHADTMPAPDKAGSAHANPTWSHDNGLRAGLDMLYDIHAAVVREGAPRAHPG